MFVHENDVPLALRPRALARADLATQVRALPIVARFVRERAFWPPPVRDVVGYGDERTLLVAGAAHRPNSRPHHRALLHRPDRDAVIVGDALVMLDPYTARTGVRLVARAATVDSARNRAALDALAATDAWFVLTGPGTVREQGALAAVAAARAAPVA